MKIQGPQLYTNAHYEINKISSIVLESGKWDAKYTPFFY